MEVKKIYPKDVIKLLELGYSRLEKDNTGIGSIEKEYNLTTAEKKMLFNYPGIKGFRKKTIPAVTMEIVDDSPTMEIVEENESIDVLDSLITNQASSKTEEIAEEVTDLVTADEVFI